jgi:hypothetical protein
MMAHANGSELSRAGIVRPRDGDAIPRNIAVPECRALLRTRNLGRVVYTEGALPAVLPVHYAAVDGRILLRVRASTPAVNKVSGSIVALEVDELETADIHGWVVLVIGLCTDASPPPREVASMPFWTHTSHPWLALEEETSIWRGVRDSAKLERP